MARETAHIRAAGRFDGLFQMTETRPMPAPRRLALVRIACLVLGMAPLASLGWYEPGHRIINQLAIHSLPAGFPSWVREPAVEERIVFLSQEPDRWRRTREQLLQHENAPDHGIDFDSIEWAGIDLSTITPFRYEFVAEFLKGRAAHAGRFPAIDPAKDPQHSLGLPGFLPWAIAEYYAKLQTQFSYLKTYERYGTPEEIADARANVVYVMGVMGHFVGDGSQPLHTSVHNRGWVGPNPANYATNDIHAWIDGGFIAKAGITVRELAPGVVPARPLDLAPRADGRDPVFVDVVDYLLATRSTVEPMYRLLKENKLVDGGPGSSEGRAFIDGRLLAAGEMLGSLWLTAWQQAAPDAVLQSTLIQRQAAQSRGE
jgi:hypothetical protein